MLAPDVFAILTSIDGRPSTPAQVVERLVAGHELETEGDGPLEVVGARLDELMALGLADILR